MTLAFGLRPVARAVGLTDKPDGGLKDHGQAIPITGGVAILSSIAIASAVAGLFDLPSTLVVLGLLLLGTYDDLRPVSPWLRLAGSAVAGGLLTLSPQISTEPGAVIITVVFVATTVNAVNLLDGADGVAAVAGAGTSLGLAVMAGLRGVDSTLGLIVLGAIGGFLIVNWPPATAFLGDGGAYVVGVYLAFLVLSAQPATAPFLDTWAPSFVTAAAVLGVFFVDLVVTMWRRLISKAKLMDGDRLHLYDRLRDRGWTARRVVLAVGLSQLIIIAILLVFDAGLAPWYSAFLSVSLLVGVVATLGLLQFASGESLIAERN